ncbi:hypothetical protein FG386_001017 [Cryptosporidium ryanae]|uniref:uncharacterized protein n=1 Tax=Cryptosporidium ryanae TaxID=515981 RepID=UPI00351A395A|nr:hypothetical protein FG386_001017 [Cryptosporidium ryanae]
MKEVYIEIALEIGESWNKLTDVIKRSIGVIDNLISNINLHLSEDILCNRLSEKVIQSSNYMIVNDYCDRVRNLCHDLLGFINQFNKSHSSNLNKAVKWINDEYSLFNRFDSDKNEFLYGNKRVLALYKSLILCTSIERNCTFLNNTISAVEKNVDYYVQYTIIRLKSNNLCVGATKTDLPLQKDIIDSFNKLSNFVCYEGNSEIKAIRNYIESK